MTDSHDQDPQPKPDPKPDPKPEDVPAPEPRKSLTGSRLVMGMCAAQVLTLIDAFAFAAILPVFLHEWGLSNSEAGWIAGIYFLGYSASVPLLVSITDRVDARRVHMLGCALVFIGAAGFTLFAEGLVTAVIFRLISGLGLGGTYMPGLRALVDRYQGPRQSRVVAFYTSSFSLGVAASFFFVGEIYHLFGWRAAFALGAAAAAAAFLISWRGLATVMPHPPQHETHFLDFRPVLKNRSAMAYILAYTAHSWELFAFRSWMVAFLAFALTQQADNLTRFSPTTVATLSGLIAMAASIGGGELAAKYGRKRTISAIMIVTAVAASLVGFSAPMSYGAVVIFMLIYAALVQADSAALTAGVVEVAEKGRRGITLATHATIGFSGAFFGPLVVGIVLDITGGNASVVAWGLAFASLGLVGVMGPVALGLLGHQRRNL